MITRGLPSTSTTSSTESSSTDRGPYLGIGWRGVGPQGYRDADSDSDAVNQPLFRLRTNSYDYEATKLDNITTIKDSANGSHSANGQLMNKNNKKKRYIKRDPKDYTSIFADRHHQVITSISKLSQWGTGLVLIYKGIPVGDGELVRVGNKNLHTTSVSMFNKFRQKGHGIHLYHALIAQAMSLGAKRLYSDQTLNKFSSRMWSVKLPEAGYIVKKQIHSKVCQCGDKHTCTKRYYIEL